MAAIALDVGIWSFLGGIYNSAMFRLSLRELLFIMLIVCIILGWQIDHRRQLRLQRVSEQQLFHLQAMIEAEGYELERDRGGWAVRFSKGPTIVAREVVLPRNGKSR